MATPRPPRLDAPPDVRSAASDARLYRRPGHARPGHARLAGILGRSALAALLVGAVTLAPAGEARPVDAGSVPRCTYGDVSTRYRGQGDWYRSLVDTKYRLSSASRPADLVPANRSGASGAGYIRRIALVDLTAMYRAARAAGARFAIQSAYRSYSTQVSTFNMWVRKAGYSRALLASARPGHSEHQLGTALDLKTPGGAAPWYYSDWGATRTGAWLARNSWRYGWVMSYPKTKSPWATCYKYEPWHFRYVGRTIAARIQSSTLAPRQWLFLKGATSTWVGGLPSPTPRPTATPSPSPSPSDEPTASPSDVASASPTDEATDPGGSPSAGATETPDATASAAPSAEPEAPSFDPESPSAEPGGEPPAP